MADISGTQKDDILYGTDDADDIRGNKGNDTIYAGGGADECRGGPGNDTIFGEDGDDFIVGAQGSDELYGGAGSDTIYYYAAHDSNAQYGFDTIHDFESGFDQIDLSNIDAVATTRGARINEAFTYVESTDGVTPGHLTLSYDANTGITTLNGYTDTVAGADFTITIFGQVNPSADILF